MRKTFLLSLLLCLGLCTVPAIQAAETLTPAIPREFANAHSDKRMVLLDFYSQVCGACQRMEPHLEAMKKSLHDKVRFERIDVLDEQTRHYAEQFRITGTPTYILYNAEGEPVYKMENLISSTILRLQILRRVDGLKKVTPPEPIPALDEAQETGKVTLVSFQNEACKPCQQADVYLNVFEKAAEDKLTVLRLNPDRKPVAALVSKFDFKADEPYYLIVDPDGQELFRYQGALDPKTFWNIIQSFTESGV